ncbi:SRPBCC domain-containing protein [Knoellia subterranea]|uniref:ATPase n=1 Tax=Knoellia subterranea KCTC 19937 TaxID=1385521 RepID=A0A0A0JK18_9MICO|nr:SRPBCC domain-containing protein [Knoellia subterranea]KGN37770.1 ATPase [Knoellia subterranea KCTC 19937]
MVDVLSQLGAVTREFRNDEVDGEPSHIQTLEQTYPSPIDDVWDAVTSAERIPRWFLPISGDLVLGGRYQLEGNAGGEVLECEPPTEGSGAARYRVTWEYAGGVTWLTVRLHGEGERTRLVLEHLARAADVPAEMWEAFGPGATGVGWDSGLLGLGLHLGATDGKLAPGEAAAWGATDEGKQFYRGAADAWGAAHAASGVDADVAQRAADATYGAYTGA